MALSAQALVIAIVYALLTVAVIALSIVSGQAAYSVFGFIAWMLYVVLTVYDTNCLVRGNCNVWSWIRTVLYIIVPLIALILLTVALVNSGKGAASEPATEKAAAHHKRSSDDDDERDD